MEWTPEFRPPDAVKVVRSDRYGPQSRMVVARRRIRAGEVIEESPIIRIPMGEVFENGEASVLNPTLSHYVFSLGEDFAALALGFGSLYNHSSTPNASFEFPRGDLLRLTALVDIEPGVEVTIHYQQGDDDDLVEFVQQLPQ